MKLNNPKISVVLAVYNGEEYLKKAIQSILDQTFSDFELIVVDDGSTDDTESVLNSFSDDRIVRIKNEKNLGLIKSLNKGIQSARGEFLARMDADDISYPDRFEKQIAFLGEHREVGVLGTTVHHTDEGGRVISTLIEPLTHAGIVWGMFFECSIIHPTVMMRKDIILSAGGYDINFPHIEDTELWMRIVSKTRFANLPEVLHEHRLHRGSIGNTQSDTQLRLSLILRSRFIQETIQKNISPNVNRWFSLNETILSPSEIEEGMSLLSWIYEYVSWGGLPDETTRKFIEGDYLQRKRFLKKGGDNIATKRIIGVLKKMLSAPLRHKLKTKFGKFFGI